MADPFLTLKQVSKHYAGVTALDKVDFEIFTGEIHCVAGENGSGKSTMIKIISGTIDSDPGSIIKIDGKQVHGYSAMDAINKGIQVIYQDLSLFPNLTVAENIALGKFIANHRKVFSWKELHSVAEKAMAKIDIHLPVDTIVSEISIADQQLVAICRALTHDVKLIIMDEPTASLTKREVDSLLAVVEDMKAKGISTIFVSHKLNEVLEIADRVSVIRDGRMVGVYPCSELNDETLTVLMTGKKVEYQRFNSEMEQKNPVLECQHLIRRGEYQDISFKLHPGEILGITGLLGSGRTELALSLFGIHQPDSGVIKFEGKEEKIESIQKAMQLGIAYVPEDRLTQGLINNQSVGDNIIITTIGSLINQYGLLDKKKVFENIAKWVKDLSIKIPATESPVQTLSGGNQQRVVLAKWIATHPKVLILDGPTIGIDVAAKFAIHEIIRELAHKGIAIILITEEIPEAYNNCNRVLVMRKGSIVQEFETCQTTQEEIQNYVNGTY
ncbi:MAG: sugar ABC transporter ATP-binding protein [Chloroflexota bacterium]